MDHIIPSTIPYVLEECNNAPDKFALQTETVNRTNKVLNVCATDDHILSSRQPGAIAQ